MRPRDFYDLGLRLADAAQSEAEQPTAVGRLYYGLHHEACCRYFRRNPGAPPVPAGNRHSELSNRFNSNPSDVDSTRVGTLLRGLSHMRSECDYELQLPLRHRGRSYDCAAILRLAMATAEDLLTALEAYSPGDAVDGCECRTAAATR